jgi:NAD(P)H-dependent flavin oxidoreductase YrpB (nitropropane dioxygenase family)
LNLDFLLMSEQVGSLEEAAKAKEAGVDGIIVQGREAGGHVIGQVNVNH